MSDDDPRWSSAAPPVAGRPDLDRPARRRDHESHHADGVEDADTTVHEGRAKGWTGSTGIVGAKVSASYDDGATWTPAKVDREHGGAFEVALRQPALAKTNGFVTLRTEAWDAGGNRTVQTVTRAYALK